MSRRRGFLAALAGLAVLGQLHACDSQSSGTPAAEGPCQSGSAVTSGPVPRDAVLPEAGSGLFKPVASGGQPRLGICYGALSSIFHDGTRLAAEDVLYAYAFAYRWGFEASARHDPEVGRATALLRQRLAGVRAVGVDTASKSIRVGDFAFVRELVLVEVYLDGAGNDAARAAAVAPPWTSVPWHVMALMEAAVERGLAAFSNERAAARGVPWLDLARAPAMNEKLAALVSEFADSGFVPAPIKHLVNADKARERWAALKEFYDKHRHFLVTAGPYRLKSWTGGATVLDVVRHISYPLGVGSYDSYAIPRRAHITAVTPVAGGLALTVEVERVEKFMRSFKIVREPLTGTGPPKKDTLLARYVVLGPDGRVSLAGEGQLADDGRMVLDLAGKLAPGDYTVMTALVLNGNTVEPDVRRIPYRAR